MLISTHHATTSKYEPCKPETDKSDSVSKRLFDAINRNPSIALELRSIVHLENLEIKRYVSTAERVQNPEVREKIIGIIFYHLTKNSFTPEVECDISKLTARSKLKKINMTLSDLKNEKKFEISNYPDNSQSIDLARHTIILGNTGLAWRSDPKLSSNASRLNAINNVLDWVQQFFDPDKGRPLTLISMGSGLLLMEQMIHLNLMEMGIPERCIQWCCIDKLYPSDLEKMDCRLQVCNKAKNSFSEKKHNVRFFPTENFYLSEKLCKEAKANSHVVLLSFNPPTESENIFKGRIVLKGQPTTPENANTVFFIFVSATNKEILEQKIRDFSDNIDIDIDIMKIGLGIRFCFDQGKIKFNLSGQLKLICSLGIPLEAALNNKLKETPEKIRRGSVTEQIKYLQSIYETTIESLVSSFGLTGMAIPFAEYGEGLVQLKRFFFESDEVTLPSAHFHLEKGNLTVTKYGN